MHENNVTDQLIATLQRASPTLTERFVREVAGVVPSADGTTPQIQGRSVLTDFRQTRGLVLGIAPTPEVAWNDATVGGGSVVDALIAYRGDLVVLIEVKVRGPLEGRQLRRHAKHWALRVAHDDLSELDDRGYRVVDWPFVAAWARGCRDDATLTESDRAAAAGLLALLDEASLPAGGGGRAEPDLVLAVRTEDEPLATALPPICARIDLARMRAGCEALYGKQGRERVSRTGCVADAKRVAQQFLDAALIPPAGIYEAGMNVMTPRRILSVLYSGEGLTDATKPAWTEMRERLLMRGADQDVLLAMLTWASSRSTKAAGNVERVASILWDMTPERTPATPELAELVDRVRI